MTSSPLSDAVANQYQRWSYPEPIFDLPAWLASNWQWFDPSHAHQLFWPDRDYRPDLDILIAGCGTNQAAVFAYTNPAARVLAIDVSQASLDHHAVLKSKYGLKNLSLERLSIEEVGSLGQEFDLVVSTGVLHHLTDPRLGLEVLGQCLRSDGVAAIMLYAKYGRIGVEMMQTVFRQLGLQQDETSLHIVRDAIQSLPQEHPLRCYMRVAPDLHFDAGIVDTFLHGREHSYTVSDCLELVKSAGLTFQDWFLKSAYNVPSGTNNTFHDAVQALPTEQQWGVMERINHRNACHFFISCRPERPPEQYRLVYTDERFFNAVPIFRYRCGLEGDMITRPDWRTTLSSDELALVRQIDGRRTVQEIVFSTPSSIPAHESFARKLFKSLADLDFIAMKLA